MSDKPSNNNSGVHDWERLVAAIIVSAGVGVPSLFILFKGTQKTRKNHLMNVFSQLFLALFSLGLLIRCFYWTVWLNQGTPMDPNDKGVSLNMRAFMLTYPQINILICSFLIQYPWLYDYILIQHGRQINLILR